VTAGSARSSASQASSDHYSYTVYADPRMAERFDAQRFGGPIGGMLAATQERVLLEFTAAAPGVRVLDVGTGTGRAAIALAARGAEVTGVDASAEMLKVAADRAAERHVTVRFEQGDAHTLPFGDGTFDVAVSLRVLMHTPGWRRCVGELCRVARTRVVLDYPSLWSAAALQAASRRIARTMGANVEAYRVFGAGTMARELARHGFVVRAAHRQFVLPIAFHKRLASPHATVRIEGALSRLGLLRLWGSPVTVVAERCASS
jgi:ubiquinone/menaquinone biosynthesis C-methylase UbiE